MKSANKIRTAPTTAALILFNALIPGFCEPAIKAEGLQPKPNLLYFRTLIKKPWWNQKWKYRIPVVIHETVGLERHRAPISVVAEFPEATEFSSIRAVTPWGEEIPSQTTRVDGAGNRLEIFFVTDLLAYEYLPCFIYFDDTDKPATDYPPGLKLTEDGRYFTLSSSEILVRLRKESPIITHIQPQGRRTSNHLYDDNGLSPEGRAEVRYRTFTPGKVIERGPLRVIVEYQSVVGGKALVFRYVLVKDANRIDYAVSGGATSIGRSIRWMPGKGVDPARPDRLYYAHQKGIRHLKIANYGPLTDNLRKEMAEGWYAYKDTDTGQVAGEIFDLKDSQKFGVYVHIIAGYITTLGARISPPMTKGALLALNDNRSYMTVREEYLAFKNPPEVHLSPIQEKSEAPATWTVPVFGKEMIRCHHQTLRHYAGGKVYPDAPHRVLPHLIKTLKRDGANWLSFWAYKPFWKSALAEGPRTEFLDNLLEQGHAAGMGVEISAPRYSTSTARELGNYDFEIYPLKDESCWRISSDKHKEAFRQKYGMETPAKVEMDKLQLPAHHNTVLFQMDEYTRRLREMADAVREKNKKVVLSDQVNVTSMTNVSVGGPHDWERHSDFLDSLSMDLYGRPTPSWKYYTKMMRATFNNEKPIMMYWGCDQRPETVRPNMDYLLMWGIDGLFHFSPGSIFTLVYEEAKKNYRRIDYTGLGDMLAQYEPVRHVALLRDREGLIDSIKRGLWTTGGSVYDGRIRNIVTSTRLQANIIFSKYFSVENLKAYPLLIVANNPVLSDGYAKVIQEYLSGGGKVIIEAEGLRNPIIQKLTRLSPKGELSQKAGKTSGPHPFTYDGYAMPVENKGSEVAMKFETGEPVLFSRNVGEGRILFTPLLLSGKVSYQPDIAEFVEGLAQELAGRLPIGLKGAGDSIDTNLLTNGKNHLLAAYNRGFSDQTAQVTFTDSKLPEILTDFSTGEQKDCKDGMEVRLPRRQVSFFHVGDRKDMASPATTEFYLKNALCYSGDPGGAVLDLVVTKEVEEGEDEPVREKKEGVGYIAILTDKGKESENRKARVKGDEGIYAAIHGKRRLHVDFIWDLKPKTIAFYDAVIISHIGHQALPPVMQKGWEEVIQEYVIEGGSVLLCHHATGYPSLCRPPFPQIGEPTGAYISTVKDMIIKAAHPIANAESRKRRLPALAKDPAFQDQLEATVFQVGGMFRSSYPDYLPIKPGADGKALVQASMVKGIGGEPVVVAGKVGKGKVIVSGMALGAKDNTEDGVSKGEEKILINMAYWLTEDE